METAPILVPPIRPGRILVVDDDAQSRRLLRDLLIAKGHHVTEAVDGEDALAAICRERPDVILLDIMMPRMDGFEVCRHVKSNPATALIYILMITSLTERVHRMKGIECGANDFLAKPVEPEEVLLRVRNAILSKQVVEELQEQRHEQASENPLQRRLRSLSASDADLAIALLTVCSDMLIWRMAVGQLNRLERDQLRNVYEQLSTALAKSGDAPV